MFDSSGRLPDDDWPPGTGARDGSTAHGQCPLGLNGALSSLKDAATADLDSVTDGELCQAALEIERMRRYLDAVSLQVLAEVDGRGSTDIEYGLRTGSWISHEARLPRGSSRSRVRAAAKVRSSLPDFWSAMAQGLLGFDHIRVIDSVANHRIISQLAELSEIIICKAQELDFDVWARQVKELAELLDQDGGHKPGDDPEDNKLTLIPWSNNSLLIDAQLTGEYALTVKDALEGRADQIFKRLTGDTADDTEPLAPSRRTLLALALYELVREALAKPIGSSKPAKAEISLVINAQDPNSVTDVHGVRIGDTGSMACLCDPVFKPVVMNTEGVVIHLGRDQRLVSNAQRHAMANRDGGCVFPGCDSPPSWVDAHHVVHWAHGGPTDLANIASLCRYHHGVTHRKGWIMGSTEDQRFWWTTPSGRTLHSQRHGVPKAA